MPIYEFECPECKNIGECFVTLDKINTEIVVCVDCKRQASRIVSCPKGGDVSDYARKNLPSYGKYDESLNVTFHSMTEKKKYLKEKGLVQTDGPRGIKKEKRVQYFT